MITHAQLQCPVCPILISNFYYFLYYLVLLILQSSNGPYKHNQSSRPKATICERARKETFHFETALQFPTSRTSSRETSQILFKQNKESLSHQPAAKKKSYSPNAPAPTTPILRTRAPLFLCRKDTGGNGGWSNHLV